MSLLETVYAQASTNFADPMGERIQYLPQIFAMVLNLILAIGTSLILIMIPLAATAKENTGKWIGYIIMGTVGLFFVWAIRTILINSVGADLSEVGANVIL